mgnify:CR=1 FL=1
MNWDITLLYKNSDHICYFEWNLYHGMLIFEYVEIKCTNVMDPLNYDHDYTRQDQAQLLRL